MHKEINLTLPVEIGLDQQKLTDHIAQKFGAKTFHKILRRSIDARKKQIKINISLCVSSEPIDEDIAFERIYPFVENAKPVIVVGAGPAGLFAALRLIELGLKPLVFERGKDVKSRRRDLAAINQKQIVNPESNYCFGEGGAGTYSDGKLYTRSKKRGDVRRILEILVSHGATSEILVDAHPHIGTNKLPKVVEALRQRILHSGGEVHFNAKVTDFIIQDEHMRGVRLADGQEYLGLGVILATGHSARDIFELLHKRAVKIEAKPFAMGVRIEHPQAFVDRCQYGQSERGLLPAAAYSLVAQTQFEGIQRGVFSFCMCPGGFIVPASTAPGELVVNGMSPSKRNSEFANSGVVVAINEPDWQPYAHFGELAALELQKNVETTVWQKTVKIQKPNTEIDSQIAPAQGISDFLNGKTSPQLNRSSYQPGLLSMDMNEVLPNFIAKPLHDGLKQFGKRMKGYTSNHGQLIGLESRTSSPVRIPRNRENLEHEEIKGLFPCGEGAGYAGGIVSAAIDGERCAEALAELYALKPF
ncbi:FAD-binding protein [Marinilongibacter aquaticus]|uniref:NAD(P)/FAD-dependent oxidoreductase n=1 Tax=Marinilongibacter aquaticus TaxID=2975157 RepID=UPI0021BD30C3|nr:FAD-binding protein [Marinilongibacter aquaticus]UBM58204.1 FAD-binding protein [Marinilongibacter aquaticus]